MKHEIYEAEVKNLVVGTGSAGFSAALRLYQLGERDTAILSAGINAGTSRNTGSDKQTYYKLSLAGGDLDSVLAMTEELFAGGCVDGDMALCEAALSPRCFYNLVELGVPFPCNEFGEYMGYKTDHDRGRRATSVGPYTSKIMTEHLEQAVVDKAIPLFDKHQLIRILTMEKKVRGVLCLDTEKSQPAYRIIWCENLILATGGPAAIYQDSVYPISQTGASGLAFEAGVRGKNLTEWQFGMASVAPRWNVSGTYMQVLPRFVSTDAEGGDECEFLLDYFDDTAQMMSLVFLKGYQWPFDTAKIYGGSSLIDLLVYRETMLRGRRVFLDFRENPGQAAIDFSTLSDEARDYLERAGACHGTPIERLAQMNAPAIDFYRDKGIDLYTERLEIAVCAQHNNGGLATDAHWETDVAGLYAVGEVCGSHGVTRPGGTALNAGQVGALRAAEAIVYGQNNGARSGEEDREKCRAQAKERIQWATEAQGEKSIDDAMRQAAKRMSRYGGMIRNEKDIAAALGETEDELRNLTSSVAADDLSGFHHLYDQLFTQRIYLSAMLDYLQQGGGSRGSALYTDPCGEKPAADLPELFTCRLDRGEHSDMIQEVAFQEEGYDINWRPVRPIPQLDYFFETQWQAYRERTADKK